MRRRETSSATGAKSANRETFRRWLEQFAGQQVDVVVEGCTGWRFIVEECRAAGVMPHLADPAEASIRIHGVTRRAKTDKVDAKGLRELGEHHRAPESWIPPAQVLEIRTALRLYHDSMTGRAAWLHRIHATLFHQGALQQTQTRSWPPQSVARLRTAVVGG